MMVFAIQPDDLIVSCSGTMGKVAIVPLTAKPGIINQALLRLTPHQKDISPLYLKFYLENETVQNQYFRNTSGSAIKNISSVSVIKQMQIPLPPLPEQKRIAAILNEQIAAVKKARAAAEAQLEAAKTLPAAYLRQVFPKPGQSLPNGWRWVKLEEISTIISKGTTPTTFGFKYTKNGIAFLRAEDLNGGAIDTTKLTYYLSNDADEALSRSRLRPGDFLITIAGTLGRVGFVPPNAPLLNCNQAVSFVRLRTESVDPQYLCYTCHSENIIAPLLRQKAGGALQNLNLQQVRSFEFPLPPLSEQNRMKELINERMMTVEKVRAATEAQLEEITVLPAALLRKAFNGEL